MNKKTKAPLITFEGIDGSGKTTVAKAIYQWLHENGHSVILTKEPGGSPLGILLRKLLLEQPVTVCAQAQYLLFAADRAQHMQEVVLPALHNGTIVLSDRMADSSLAYQGYGNGLDLHMIRTINQWTMHHHEPDLVIYIAVDIDVAQQRIQTRGKAISFDSASRDFLERLKNGYEEIFKNRTNAIKIDGNKPLTEVIDTAIQKLRTWMK